MPLAAPIGSGLGILNKTNIKIIRNQTKLPLIIDAGLGEASDATIAMELGCDGVLVNTAIARANNPMQMALAFKNSVIAIGNPFGLGHTVTSGIVSAFNRDINSGPYDSFIQTDFNGTNPFGTPDSTAIFPKEIYYVDRKSAENRTLIEFELASAFDLAGVRAPKRQCISRCQWVYKSVECGYDPTVGPGKVVNGVTFTRFTANDVGTTVDSEDVCGKRQSSCECRFGENKELPFGGYPGIGTFFA